MRCSKPHYFYSVYGLALGSDIRIPGLAAEQVEDGPVDIMISMGRWPADIHGLLAQPSVNYFTEPGHEKNAPPRLIVSTPANGRHFHFCYDNGIEFVIDSRSATVWGKWEAPLVLEDAALYLMGPIIGFMLRLRGITCLHASGVVVDGQAFALTGPSGAGKSTLAASMAAADYPVLTDDVLPLTTENGLVYTQSGYSRLRLFPDSFENLQELPDVLPQLAPGWDKCYLDLASGSFELHRSSSILRVIYVIERSEDSPASASVEHVTGVAALPLLALNTYRTELLNSEMRAQEFGFLSRLVSRVKVKKLHSVNDISAVPQIRDILIDDFRKEIAPQEQAVSLTDTRENIPK